MRWLKAALIGAVASLVMFLLIKLTLNAGMAPFEAPPSAAIVESVGLDAQPWGVVAHFGYGILGAIVLVALYGGRTNTAKGVGLAAVLWLLMQLVWAPMIGLGFFGTNLPQTSMFLFATATLYLIYGLIVGGMASTWIMDRAPGILRDRPRTPLHS